LVRHGAHLGLEEFGLDPQCVLRSLALQLVAKVERRSDVALHEVRELLGVIGDP
jgi:hypothetical protein